MIWYVFGAGGLGKETMDLIHSKELVESKINEVVFLVDQSEDDFINGKRVVLFKDIELPGFFTVAIGEPVDRENAFNRLVTLGLQPKSILAGSAIISPSAEIGTGCIIGPMVSVQANAKISNNVVINTQAIIGHDSEIGSHSVVSSQVNLGGGTKVGPRTYLGMGAKFLERLSVGEGAIVGMGSVVYKNVPAAVICLGSPARVIKNNVNKKVFK